MKSRKGIGLVVALVLVLGAFGYMVYGGIGENLVYFLEPPELLARGEAAYDTPVRLGGMVVPGSVVWDAEAINLSFEMKSSGTETIEVHSSKAPPQMFRENMGVVVEGKLTRAGVFEASNVMVRHSNEYSPPAPGEDPHTKYRSLVQDQT